MNLSGLLAQILAFVGDFSPNIGIFLFLVCFVGEAFVISIPLVFEVAWLGAGIQLTQGTLSIPDLLGMMLSAQAGRQAGALILYAISRRGTTFFSRFIARRLPKTIPEEGAPGKLLSRIDSISPFGVAVGRMLWIRIPLTLLLGARRKLKTLMLGIAISGTIYDGMYIGIGAVFGAAVPESEFMLLYLLGGLIAFYAVAFSLRLAYKAIRRAFIRRRERLEGRDGAETSRPIGPGDSHEKTT